MKLKITGGFTYSNDKGVTIPPKTQFEYKGISKDEDYIEIPLVENEKEMEK